MKIHRMARWVATGCALALVLAAVASRVTAEPPWAVSVRPEISSRPLSIDRGSAALWQSLLKLHTRASMMMIDAHPDDEDGGLLAYESRGHGARVALLTLNRGESGQNYMTADYFDAMGLLRSQELLAAGRYYGAQQYFTRVIDFGFSKSKEETMQKWGHERVLYDVVRAVRMNRPLVLTSVFVGGHSDGHGHHQVSGQLTQEAFKDAGDPHIFPDQIRDGLRPWTPLKDYARVPTFAIRKGQIWDYANGHTYPLRFYNYISGKWIDGMLSTDITIPEGQFDPLLGETFMQMRMEGLSFQKSQNGGTSVPPPGPANVGYHLFGSRVQTPAHSDSIFSGIDVSLGGIADLAAGQNDAFLKTGLAGIDRDVQEAMQKFDALHPEEIAPMLAGGAKANLALIGQVRSSSLTADAKYNVLNELRIKQAQFNTALAESLGLSVDASVTPARVAGGRFGRRGQASTPRVAIPGQTVYVSVRAANEGNAPVTVGKIWIDTPQGARWTVSPLGKTPASIAAGQAASQRFKIEVAQAAKFTRPYFSRSNLEQAYYNIDNPKYLNLPFEPYPVSGWMEFKYQGVTVRVGQVAQTFQRQAGFGNVAQPLVVAPAISLWISPQGGVAPLGAKSFPVSVLVHSNVQGPAQGTVRMDLPAGWSSKPGSAPFSVAKSGEDQTVHFEIYPANLQAKPYQLHAVASYGGRQYPEGYKRVGYGNLRSYYFYRPAGYKITGTGVKIASGIRVGYVAGTGDQVPECLEDLGVQTTFLSAQDLASGDLAKFSAIILGVRAYSVRPDLATYSQRLLAYVRQGGLLIAQYQAGDSYDNYVPYRFHLGGAGQTITDEHSAVQFLLPSDPAMIWPNKIGQQDFKGWIEERAHGVPESWDAHWQAPVEMHDQGQAPQKGSLLIARYGKGVYVYLALALYRQLPEGVPGPYRIFANLLSLGGNPGLHSAETASKR